MNSKNIPFWESNLNPITMFVVSVNKREVKKNEGFQVVRNNNNQDLTDFVSAKQLTRELGIGLKNLRYLFEELGEYPIVVNMKMYYQVGFTEQLQEMILESSIPKEIFDNVLYVTNRELMEMFSINQFKAWEIARKSTLVKKKTGRNQVYYNREEAVKFFSEQLKR